MSKLLDILLHIRIVKTEKIYKISKIFDTTLDHLLGRGYIIYISVQTIGHLIKNGFRRHREPKWLHSGAEGEFYERNEKFNGMA
jgi:hypothetical protein